MPDPETGLTTLRSIVAEFSTFCATRGGASEADTRAKMIDRILREVLQWPESELSREDHVDSGFIDYTLALHGKPYLAVEAKKEDNAFTLPHKRRDKRYVLDGVLVTDIPIKKAIEQVRQYCDDANVPIKYAMATNGYTWILFQAIRDDIGWRKGNARVFPGIEDICEHFTEFWNLLSYPSIESGSLQDEFTQAVGTPRKMLRVIDKLFNANLPLRRNRLHIPLRPYITLIFEDIADQDQLDVLHECYIHTGSLTIVQNDLDNIITESIPRFLVQEGTKPVGEPEARTGFEKSFSRSLGSNKGMLFLILGGIGCGKTTFLKRYQRTSGQTLLDKNCLWFSVDFLGPPIDPASLEQFVWRNILATIRERYKDRGFENLHNLREIFRDRIKLLEATALSGVKQKSLQYDKLLGPYLLEWQQQLADYVPSLLLHSCILAKRKPTVFIDNVDQLAPEYQGEIFLLAQHITRRLESITLVSLREESYYTASTQKRFTAYTNHSFHIASPRFRVMIVSRIKYAISLLGKQQREQTNDEDVAGYGDISSFLLIVRNSVFEGNRNIIRFVEAMCYGNMRLALNFFTTFLTSGATDVDKMLNIHRRDGSYNVAFHEFVKSIMLGDRQYYKEDQSPVMNIFNVGSERRASHFTGWRVINVLYSRRGQTTEEGRGYMPLSELIAMFENRFNNRGDLVATLNRLVSKQLVETNTRSMESIEGASHIRVTSAGWYYVRYLIRAFAYLDLILQDTPFNDEEIEATLRQSVSLVSNLGDREEDKLERIRVRFQRVEQFVDYLGREEGRERNEYRLEESDGPIGERLVRRLETQFRQERDWIERRIRENRERYSEIEPFENDEPEVLDNEEESESKSS